jgi:hypothetical protein
LSWREGQNKLQHKRINSAHSAYKTVQKLLFIMAIFDSISIALSWGVLDVWKDFTLA